MQQEGLNSERAQPVGRWVRGTTNIPSGDWWLTWGMGLEMQGPGGDWHAPSYVLVRKCTAHLKLIQNNVGCELKLKNSIATRKCTVALRVREGG